MTCSCSHVEANTLTDTVVYEDSCGHVFVTTSRYHVAKASN